ncbi:metallophosphoesterase [Mycobacteroides saopaulense]|uniref:metallophosphoesterase family protein n=1 Tax=Mycobacteroides saopaulense TaxID=1578165 RepID=UPI00071FFE60|nr:metallophosphoesterase [Mycobacteroides saopaulense]ALR11796.1 metallophosphoesterase [Mycobacteroides saopaulense]
MIRIAAVGDIHLGEDSGMQLRPAFQDIEKYADILLLAGDLTRTGTVAEATVVASEFGGLAVPVIAVLGNHDYHANQVPEITEILRSRGIIVLDGNVFRIDIAGLSVGIAGIKGFGGGFAGRCGSNFGEAEMKAFIGYTQSNADRLARALRDLDTDLRIALLHYAPTPETLGCEPPEIYPFLGSYLLGEAIDAADADLAVHGHAHAGAERGSTPGGTPVRNVAQPVLHSAYAVYALAERASPSREGTLARTVPAQTVSWTRI